MGKQAGRRVEVRLGRLHPLLDQGFVRGLASDGIPDLEGVDRGWRIAGPRFSNVGWWEGCRGILQCLRQFLSPLFEELPFAGIAFGRILDEENPG